jgi:phosphatidylglycerophosphatase C
MITADAAGSRAALADSRSGAREELALFDFDGTLTTCETFPMFIARAVPRGRLIAGWLRLWPLVLGYRLGRVSGVRVREAIVRFGLQGLDWDALEAEGARFARDVLPGLIRPHAWARLQWHRQRGDRVVVVSGGLGAYLRPWAEAQRLELICSELAQAQGRCSGRFAGAQCVGAEKARRVRVGMDLADYPLVHAYGDTPEDAELLALADRAIYRWQGVGEGSA